MSIPVEAFYIGSALLKTYDSYRQYGNANRAAIQSTNRAASIWAANNANAPKQQAAERLQQSLELISFKMDSSVIVKSLRSQASTIIAQAEGQGQAGSNTLQNRLTNITRQAWDARQRRELALERKLINGEQRIQNITDSTINANIRELDNISAGGSAAGLGLSLAGLAIGTGLQTGFKKDPTTGEVVPVGTPVGGGPSSELG